MIGDKCTIRAVFPRIALKPGPPPASRRGGGARVRIHRIPGVPRENDSAEQGAPPARAALSDGRLVNKYTQRIWRAAVFPPMPELWAARQMVRASSLGPNGAARWEMRKKRKPAIFRAIWVDGNFCTGI